MTLVQKYTELFQALVAVPCRFASGHQIGVTLFKKKRRALIGVAKHVW